MVLFALLANSFVQTCGKQRHIFPSKDLSYLKVAYLWHKAAVFFLCGMTIRFHQDVVGRLEVNH